jgi:ATP-dependent DNA helicase RecG
MFGTPIQIRIEDKAMIISNRCILPDGWTAETLMEPHDSIPYNPDIANVFYRAGYIETWGRGIQKICDECRALGADLPRYEILGNGMRIHFKALESALIDTPQILKRHDDVLDGVLDGVLDDVLDGVLDDVLANRIIEMIRNNPKITQTRLAELLDVSYRTLQRKIVEMKTDGRIARVEGKRYGHWEINE